MPENSERTLVVIEVDILLCKMEYRRLVLQSQNPNFHAGTNLERRKAVYLQLQQLLAEKHAVEGTTTEEPQLLERDMFEERLLAHIEQEREHSLRQRSLARSRSSGLSL